MSVPEARPNILVLGSMSWELTLRPDPKNASRAPISLAEYRRHCSWVGAPTVRKMVIAALAEETPGATQEDTALRVFPGSPPDLFPAPGALPSTVQHAADLLRDCGELTTVFAEFPKSSLDGKKKPARVVRVKDTYYARDSAGASPGASLMSYLRSSITDSPKPDIIVIFERDQMFRRHFEALLADCSGHLGPPSSTRSDANTRRTLIVASAHDIDAKWILTVIDSCRRHDDHVRSIVLVTAEALRRTGLNLVEYGSIEQTVREVVRFLDLTPLKQLLPQADDLVILFEETGAIHLNGRHPATTGSIHFCPNFDRAAQMDPDGYGSSPGRTAIALAAIVKQIDADMTRHVESDLASGIRLGLVGYNKYFADGFGEEQPPFAALENSLGLTRRQEIKTLLEGTDQKKKDREFYISSLVFPRGAALDTWSRVDGMLDGDHSDEKIRALTRDIVWRGADAAFRRDADGRSNPWFPGRIIACPYLAVGELRTVDPVEISGLASVAKLIRKYLHDEPWTTPLSIATFGPPGSGKSFGIKQVLKAVNPSAKDQPVLTFNLAQFDSLALLTEAFHQVQDRALASEEVPLVIFDEFDSEFDAPLGWLKYFLAPMQDGLFRGQATDYRVGRAIFVFTGGTADSFASFVTGGSQSDQMRRRAKLPDFVSRLKGYMNVLGINPARESNAGSRNRSEIIRERVRRAMTLRSMLLATAKPVVRPGPDGEEDLINIAKEVIDAFVEVPRYEHGVRSMEALVRMARSIGGQILPASMPAKEQLDMHAQYFWDKPPEIEYSPQPFGR